MISHTKELDNTGNISFRCLQKVLAFVFLLLFLHLGLSGRSEVAAKPVPSLLANAQSETGETKADFLFQRPRKFFGFRIGKFFPRADSGLFDMITRELTLEKSDFRAWDFGIDGGFSMHQRVDLVFSFDYSKRTKNSEFRDFIDEQGLPITQNTSYSQIPLIAGVKFLLVPQGRQVGQYAWLPSRIVPFVGSGGGILWYQFKQDGDFVDFTTLEIFPATLESSGWVPTVYLGGGADIHLFKSAYLTLDLRYSWANHELKRDFVGFDPIDLSGLRLTTGIYWHF